MVEFLPGVLVLASIAVLARALFLTRRLIAELPAGRLRDHWRVLLAMIGAFIVGYAAYLALFAGNGFHVTSLVVPAVFFLGAGYVWFSVRLALETADGVKRIAQLELDTVTDPLTKVYNRRYLDQRLVEEVARAGRYDAPLSVMLLDVDNFKNVNDSYGHHVGDELLRRCSSIIVSALRESDFVARFGGEEFFIVAPQTALADAKLVAERLRGLVVAEPFKLPPEQGGDPMKVTVSIGVASFGGEVKTVEELVRAADSCLYRAKRLGRNRVVADDVRSAPSVSAA